MILFQEWEKKVNRVLQQKDEKIKLIFEEITTTEEMHKNYFSTQIQIMDYLKGYFIILVECIVL